MHKRMTITLDEEVYEGLNRTIGKRRMSQFIEDLLRPHVLDSALDDGYRAMAEIRRISDGVVICTAEGFVGDDEQRGVAALPEVALHHLERARLSAVGRAGEVLELQPGPGG